MHGPRDLLPLFPFLCLECIVLRSSHPTACCVKTLSCQPYGWLPQGLHWGNVRPVGRQRERSPKYPPFCTRRCVCVPYGKKQKGTVVQSVLLFMCAALCTLSLLSNAHTYPAGTKLPLPLLPFLLLLLLLLVLYSPPRRPPLLILLLRSPVPVLRSWPSLLPPFPPSSSSSPLPSR